MWRPGPGADDVHLQVVGVDDIRRDRFGNPPELRGIFHGRWSREGDLRQQTQRPGAVLAEPGQPVVEGHDERRDAERGRVLQERTIGGRYEVERPRRLSAAHARQDVEQAALSAAKSGFRTQVQNAHVVD